MQCTLRRHVHKAKSLEIGRCVLAINTTVFSRATRLDETYWKQAA